MEPAAAAAEPKREEIKARVSFIVIFGGRLEECISCGFDLLASIMIICLDVFVESWLVLTRFVGGSTMAAVSALICTLLGYLVVPL